MGYWGMGLAQNDEFCEIYERFMDEYDAGRPVEEISAELLEEWLEAFDAADGVMHNVWFALAKAQWMCGGAAPDVLAQVERIVESGADLAYLKELEATERDLKARQKALEKFLSSLRVPREKPRKRKTSEEKYREWIAQEPFRSVRAGDVFAMPAQGGWRVVLCIERGGSTLSGPMAYLFVWQRVFADQPEVSGLTQEKVLPMVWTCGRELMELGLVKLGRMRVSKDLIFALGRSVPCGRDRLENGLQGGFAIDSADCLTYVQMQQKAGECDMLAWHQEAVRRIEEMHRQMGL